MAIAKKPFDQYGVDISLEHQGRADTLEVGVVLYRKDGTVAAVLMQDATYPRLLVPDDLTPKRYSLSLRGPWPSGLVPGELIDVQMSAWSQVLAKDVWSPPRELDVWQNRALVSTFQVHLKSPPADTLWWYAVVWNSVNYQWVTDGADWRTVDKYCGWFYNIPMPTTIAIFVARATVETHYSQSIYIPNQGVVSFWYPTKIWEF